MASIIKTSNYYSVAVAYCSYISCFFTWLLLLSNASVWWIPLGLIMLIILVFLTTRPKSLKNRSDVIGSNNTVYKILIFLSSLIFFLASIYGFISIILVIPIRDNSIMLMPIMIVGILFLSVAIGIYQEQSR